MLRPVPASLCLAVILVATLPATAQDNRLTVDRIFGSGEFNPRGFSVNWMPEGGSYHILERAAEGAGHNIVLVDPLTQGRQVLVTTEQLTPEGSEQPIDVSSFRISPNGRKILVFNNTRRVWRYHTRGDYWVVDLDRGTVQQLGGSESPESSLMFAKFSPDSRRVAWVRDGNVFVEDLPTGQIRQITEQETPHIINGTSDWVYEEELDLRDGFRWSDDGGKIVYWRFDTSGVGEFTMINNTDQLYPELTRFQYPKVGTTNSAVTLRIHDLESGETRTVDLPGDPRDNYPARVDWIPGTDRFLMQRLNRLQNENTLSEVDAASGQARIIGRDSDAAWVEVCDGIKWTPEAGEFTFVSEADGWKHVYLIDRETGQRQLLTPGEFDVMELYHIDLDERACYFLASPDDPTGRYLYRQEFGSPELQRLTPADQPGWHQYSLAADAGSAVHTWSRFDMPPRSELVALPDHRTLQVAEDNEALQDRLDQLESVEHEFFQVTIEDEQGQPLVIDGWLMKPAGFDPERKYPAIVHVYGEPWGTTVTDRWNGGNAMWHRLLCEHGYAVLSFDNRGSKVPRGSHWRKAIYRKIGIVNAADQAAALAATLEQIDWLDEQRIGIWGWSGGGSSTLNALFKYPDLYHAGISIAPVPDQRYYDTIYQERYMQTPQLNPQGFREGSPITHAGDLQGRLLLIHGTGDDNCHYQTMELLINELVARDKQFSMMAYPNRSHSIREYENTSRHLRKLMTGWMLENLPPGPRDPAASDSGQGPLQIEATGDDGLAGFFDKQVDVLGIPVLATATTPDHKLLHAASVLAQYIDNDEDGEPDNPRVLEQMRGAGAALVMAASERELERRFDRIPGGTADRHVLQALWAEETVPDGARDGVFDATLEEALHLVTHAGYSRVYPEVFGEQAGSRIAAAMDQARGGHFRRVPREYPEAAWYTYDDRTCDYRCQVTEYFYWGLTSRLGGQEFPGRLQEIQHEWRLNTDRKLREGDPALYELLSDPRYRLPTRLPDGRYRTHSPDAPAPAASGN